MSRQIFHLKSITKTWPTFGNILYNFKLETTLTNGSGKIRIDGKNGGKSLDQCADVQSHETSKSNSECQVKIDAVENRLQQVESQLSQVKKFIKNYSVLSNVRRRWTFHLKNHLENATNIWKHTVPTSFIKAHDFMYTCRDNSAF